MESARIRESFLDFFKKRGHAVVSSSSLVPDDPSVLLTTAGMQQFKKYYTGEVDPLKDFGSKNVASIQKSFRTSDIDEVGDETHLTFFEMLGNFSFGGYLKKEAIEYAYDFLTKELGLSISYVTVFKGSEAVPKDEESRGIWKSINPNLDIREEGMEDVFWGPTGSSGPCGPTTEIYCMDVGGNNVEIWNIVFNEFFFPGSREELLSGASKKKLEKLKTPGVDTGAGFERLTSIAQQKRSIYATDLFAPLLELLPSTVDVYHGRIIVDHLRGSTFLLADGVRPSNKERGYILRRLIRRALVYENIYKIPPHVFDAIVHDIVHEYGDFYPELMQENENIREELVRERRRFSGTLERGIKELSHKKSFGISSDIAFYLYESYGLPYEVTKELGGDSAADLTRDAFDAEFKKHQEVSRAGKERKFGGHGLILDTGELKASDERELKVVTRLHTATHLLNSALRRVLGPDIQQQGSDINVERTRFDFTFLRRLTSEEVRAVEDLVNYAIGRDFMVDFKEMPFEEAKKTDALRFWKEKYPAVVKVYSVYDPKTGETFSREFCGGPHVDRTAEIGKFRIIKEESSSAGVRRIRGVVE